MRRAAEALFLLSLAALAGCAQGRRPSSGVDGGPVGQRDSGSPDAGGPACESASECDDGDACNGVEVCSDGQCLPGIAIECADAVDCTADRCDPLTGACSYPADDARCPSGMICDPLGGCETPLPCESDAECDDGVFCNGTERCDPAIGCRRDSVSCDDGVPCTIDTCDALADACASAPDHGRCSDGLACNGAEQCVVGLGCMPGTSVACDDGVACTMDRCLEPAGTCSSTGTDADGDGHVVVGCLGGDDCNDLSAAVHPGATEVCDGVDNDCNGAVDDGPSFSCALGSAPASCTTACGTSGTRSCTASCTFGLCVAATETCGNGCDDDGDGMIDEGCVTVPPNDACSGAIALSGTGTRSDTLVSATAQASDCGTGVEVFYSVTVSVPSIVYLSTLGGASFDTRLSYRGTSCPGASGQCVDDSCGSAQTHLAQLVTSGTHYFAVHTFSSFTTPGAFTLRYGVYAAAGQDNVVLALAAAGTTVTQPGSTTSGTSRVDGSCAGGSGPEDSFYWLQCPSDTRSYAANTCTGTSYDSQLMMRFNGAEIGCNDDSCGVQSSLTSSSAAGAGLVQLFVDGYSSGSYGSYSVAIRF